MKIGPRVRTGGQVAFFTILLGLVGCGSETGTPMDLGDEVQPPGPVSTLPFTLDALRTGNIDKILHCSGPLWNPEEHDGYLAALPAETLPLMVRFGTSLTPTERFTSAEKLDMIRATLNRYPLEVPHLTITFTKKLLDGTPVGLDQETAAGDFDDLIIAIAEIARDTERPFFVRVAAEFNGFWNAYSPEYFPDAFRRIVDLFRSVGADNAIFNWNYKAWQGDPVPYMAYYPGDGYVDWWSIDLFTSDIEVPAVQAKVETFLADAAARGKPVIIPESAPSGQDMEDPATWDRWFAPYFELVRSDPNIKGFCYSNRDFAKNDVTLTEWGNLRIDQSGALLPKYIQELAKPEYQHQVGGG